MRGRIPETFVSVTTYLNAGFYFNLAAAILYSLEQNTIVTNSNKAQRNSGRIEFGGFRHSPLPPTLRDGTDSGSAEWRRCKVVW